MRVDSHDGVRGTLYADFGQGERPVSAVIWFDCDTGEFEAFRVGPGWTPFSKNYRAHLVRVGGRLQRYKGKAQKLRYQENLVESSLAASRVSVAEPIVRRSGARVPYDPRRRCQGYACDRHAAWAVVEELEEPPQTIGNTKFERASLLKVKYWCDWCYEPPQLVDDKGDIVTTYDEISARPQ